MNKPKVFYVGAVFTAVLIGLALVFFFVFSPRTFNVVSQEGGAGVGASGKGISSSMKSWVSPDGISVQEIVVSYSSPDEARSDFQLELSRAESIVDDVRDSSPPRVLAKFGPSFKAISLQDNRIRYVVAPDAKTVQEFEKSVLKFGWY